jgi:hypothetical protein
LLIVFVWGTRDELGGTVRGFLSVNRLSAVRAGAGIANTVGTGLVFAGRMIPVAAVGPQ